LKTKHERDSHLTILEEELRMIKEKYYRIGKYQKSHPFRISRSDDSHTKEGSLRIHDYYQPTPRRTRRESFRIETKVDLPHFPGKENVEFYLDMEMKVKQLFVCYHVSKERKIPLTSLRFQNNAMYWWTSLGRERHHHKEPPITYWNDLWGALRRRHIHSYYDRELMDKIQRLQQKNMSVEEYRRKIELYIMRETIREEENAIISRFLSGLSLEIRNKVELFSDKDLNILVQLCIKVGQTNLKKGSSCKESSYSNFYTRKSIKENTKGRMLFKR